MATRADHYRWADELVWKARRAFGNEYPDENTALWLAAAQVHATLASVPLDVEREDVRRQLAEGRAVARAEEVRVGLLGGSVEPVVESPAFGTEPRDDQR